MELIIVIGLMAILYIAPELLRGQRKKEYEYPDIPQNKPKPELPMKHLPHLPPVLAAEQQAIAKPLVKGQSFSSMPPVVDVPSFITESPEGNSSAWVNGIIMAEILMPPRAHRPIIYQKKL